MEDKEFRKKLLGQSVGSLLILGMAPRAVPESIIDYSVYRVDRALYIPKEDWKH